MDDFCTAASSLAHAWFIVFVILLMLGGLLYVAFVEGREYEKELNHREREEA